jgi:hypothetical protein
MISFWSPYHLLVVVGVILVIVVVMVALTLV